MIIGILLLLVVGAIIGIVVGSGGSQPAKSSS